MMMQADKEPMNRTDEDLAQAFMHRGCQESGGILYERYRPALTDFLRRYVRDRHIAEDLVQDTFLRLPSAGQRYNPAFSFKNWVFSVAANLAKNWLKAARIRRTVSLGESSDEHSLNDVIADLTVADPHTQAEEREDVTFIQGCLDELPPDESAAFNLIVEGHQYNEVADLIGVPVGTLKSRVSRTAKTIRRARERMIA
jgi:RNA polymerase sigma-70 factor (ECF subfamily)